MRTLVLLLVASGFLLLSGCKNDNGGPSARFSVRVAGANWSASRVFANVTTVGGTSTRILTAEGPGGDVFTVTVVTTSTGNLSLDDDVTTSTASVVLTRNGGTSVFTSVSGSMNVTNNTSENFSATFSGTVQAAGGGATLELSSGSIINVRTLN